MTSLVTLNWVENGRNRTPLTYSQVLSRLANRVAQAQSNPKKLGVRRGYVDFSLCDVETVVTAAKKAETKIQSLQAEIEALRAQLKVIEPTPPSNMRQEPKKESPQKVVVSDETLNIMRSLKLSPAPIPHTVKAPAPVSDEPVWLTVRQYAEAYKVTVDQVNGFRRRKDDALPSRKLKGMPWQVMDVPY